MSKLASKSPSSLWQTPEDGSFSELETHLELDVCIVGAGIAGLTTAYLLAKEGRKVVVLDASGAGRGETGNTTAHLASAIDENFTELEKLFGVEGSRLAADSHRAAIDTIQSICLDESIDCDFERVDAYLFSPPGGSSRFIEHEYEASRRAGFLDCERFTAAPLEGPKTGPCIRYPNQAQINPTQYIQGVLKAYIKLGGSYYPSTEVVHIEEGKRAEVFTRSGLRVIADSVLIATNSPMNDRLVMHTKQAPYRTYVLAFEAEALKIPRALYWDTVDPYHYIRFAKDQANRDLLIVGGEDHKVGQKSEPEISYRDLELWAREFFPGLGAIRTRWSGQVLEPVDGLAFIGRNPGSHNNIYIATGDSGNGMTHGTIAGQLISDLIQGRPNVWTELYDPARKNLHVPSVSTFLKENSNVAAQYFDYLRGGDVESVKDIGPGEGAIMRYGLQKVAVYRDEDQQIHCLSAVCPHLAGIVRWNQVEKSWDCPCHGSRFDVDGNVINGPATSELAPMSLDAPTPHRAVEQGRKSVDHPSSPPL